MSEVVAVKPTLSDSVFKTRPNFKSYIQTDQNAGMDAMQIIEAKRRARQMKFPNMHGCKTAQSLKEDIINPGFVKWNDEGDHRSTAPSRFYGTIVDPVSGFLSASGDVHRNTGVTKIKSFVHVSTTPQDNSPQTTNSIRMRSSAPPELRRESTFAAPSPSYWNSRKTLDISTRAKVGGWTSDKDPRKLNEETMKDADKDLREKLADQYMYKSSTQQQYEDVPWDNMLPPKQWAPVTTLEPKPDQVDQRYKLKRYGPSSHEYQLLGRSWDWFQTRNGYYKNPQWIDFTSPCPRAQQVPLYGGCIGATNLDEIDNQVTPFKPFTVKRVNIPREAETAHRPNIPGYTGSTLYQSVRPAESQREPTPKTASSGGNRLETTTGAVHQSMPSNTLPAVHKRDAQMSKMVTTVPPCNPFNRVNLMPQKLEVN